MQESDVEGIVDARDDFDLDDAITAFLHRKALERRWIEAAHRRLSQLKSQHKGLAAHLIFIVLNGLAIAVGIAACFALGLRYFWPEFVPSTLFNRRIVVFVVFIAMFSLSLGLLQRTLPRRWWSMLGALDAIPEYAATMATLRSLTEKAKSGSSDQPAMTDFKVAPGLTDPAIENSVQQPAIDLGLDGFEPGQAPGEAALEQQVTEVLTSGEQQDSQYANLTLELAQSASAIACELIAAFNPSGRILTEPETFALQLVLAGMVDGLSLSPEPDRVAKMRLMQVAQEAISIDRVTAETFTHDAIKYFSCAKLRSLIAAGRAVVANLQKSEVAPFAPAVLAVNDWIGVKDAPRVPSFAVLMFCKFSNRTELENILGRVEARVICNFQDTTVKREVERCRGAVLGINGGAICLFDSAQQAAEAAVKIMSANSDFLASRKTDAADLKIAIHSGHVWKEDGSIHGHLQDVVEEMSVRARNRQVLVSEPVRSACRYSNLKFAKRGDLLAAPAYGESALYEIVWAGNIEYSDIGRRR